MALINIKNPSQRRVFMWSGFALVGIVVVAAVAIGPMLYGYYRFADHVETTSQQRIAAGGNWPRVSDACMPCHGVGGNPVSPVYARLAGQPEAYLVQQLSAFASGERQNPTMSPLALDLGPEEIKRLAAFFAAQPVVVDTTLSLDPARVAKGEALAKAGNCVACHGPALLGQDAHPRLAGQGSVYLAKQLRDFKSGTRRDALRLMPGVAASLSDEDIENLAHYLSSLGTPGR